MSLTRYYYAGRRHERIDYVCRMFDRYMAAAPAPLCIHPRNDLQIIDMADLRLFIHVNELVNGRVYRLCRVSISILGMPGPMGFMKGLEDICLPEGKDAVYFDTQAPLPVWLEESVLGHILPRLLRGA